jgi:hypothetical protein
MIAAPLTLDSIAPERRPSSERAARDQLLHHFRHAPFPDEEVLANAATFIPRQTLARLLALVELYKLILPVHGAICEFGCRWGQTLALFTSLRGMFEPHNLRRPIYGFDTFTGLAGVEARDGASPAAREGAYGVAPAYAQTLGAILECHEALSPIAHIKKTHVIEGDVTQTLQALLDQRPETLIALAYFDMDIYAPTKAALDLVLPRMPKGAVIGFDEAMHPDFPGETRAILDTFDLRATRLQRFATCPDLSFIVLE